MQAQSFFETERASRHMTALCRHFGRKVDARSDARNGWVQFPFGRCEMTASAQSLSLLASAEDAERLDRVLKVVTSHLERFAFSETPDLTWRSLPAPPDQPRPPHNPTQPRSTS